MLPTILVLVMLSTFAYLFIAGISIVKHDNQ